MIGNRFEAHDTNSECASIFETFLINRLVSSRCEDDKCIFSCAGDFIAKPSFG